MQDSEIAERIINSHKWVMDFCGPHGQDGVFARMHCSLCGLGKVMIVYDIEDSIKSLRTSFDKDYVKK